MNNVTVEYINARITKVPIFMGEQLLSAENNVLTSTYNTNLRFLLKKIVQTQTFPGREDGAEALNERALCTVVLAPIVTGDIHKVGACHVLHLQVGNIKILKQGKKLVSDMLCSSSACKK